MSPAPPDGSPVRWYPILVAAASVGIANSVIFSLLSNLQDEYGFSDAGLGLIAGSGFAVGLVGQLLLAPLADRGHSKTLVVAGLGTAVAGSVLFAVASSLPMLVLARMMVGLSNSLYGPAARAIVISAHPENVATRLGTLTGVELAGFVTGPVLGGMLVGPTGLRTPFLVAGSFALVGILLVAPRRLPAPPTDTEHRLAFDLLRLPRIRAGVLMSVALFLPVGFYDATLDRYLTDLGGSDTLIGFTFLAYGVPFALLATRGGRMSGKYGAMRVAVVGTLLVTPITVAYGFMHLPMLILVFSAVEGTIQAMAVPAGQAIVAEGAPIGRAAAAQGLSGASTLLVAAVTAYAGGAIYGALGAAWMFSIAGAAMVTAVGLAVMSYRQADPVGVVSSSVR